MKTDQMQTRARHQSGQALHEFQRRYHDMARAVAIGGLQLSGLASNQFSLFDIKTSIHLCFDA